MMSGTKRFTQSDYDEWQEMRNAGISIMQIAEEFECHYDTVVIKTKTPENIITLGRLYKMLKDGDHVGNKTIVYAGKVCGKFEQEDENNG